MINHLQQDAITEQLRLSNTRYEFRGRLRSRAGIAAILAAGALVSLLVPSLIQSDQQANAQSEKSSPPANLQVAPSADPQSSDRPFFFGYLVFENDPADGIPGFSAIPSHAQRDELHLRHEATP